MAVDQREALIAAVRAQVEKERAEKQKKLEREQEAMALSKKSGDKKKETEKKQYKTLSPEELAKIEEKKRRKRAEELGIDLDEKKNDEPELNAGETSEGLGGGLGGGLGSTESTGGLGSTPSGGLGSTEGGLGSTPSGGLGLNLQTDEPKVKVVDGGADDKYSFSPDGTKTVSEDNGWISDKKDAFKDDSDDIDSIIPDRKTPTNDVDSM